MWASSDSSTGTSTITATDLLRRVLGVTGLSCLLFGAALAVLPVPELATHRVEGTVLEPSVHRVPFGPPAAFAWIRVVAFPGDVATTLIESPVGPRSMQLQTTDGVQTVVLPPSGRWHRTPGLSWEDDRVFRPYTTLEGPLLGALDVPPAPNARGYRVVVTRLEAGETVVIERPGTEDAALWRGSAAAVTAGHRQTTWVAMGGLWALGLVLLAVARGR